MRELVATSRPCHHCKRRIQVTSQERYVMGLLRVQARVQLERHEDQCRYLLVRPEVPLEQFRDPGEPLEEAMPS